MPPRTPKTTAAPWVPDHGRLAELQRAARECRGCNLWRNATQTVFGEGPAHPDLVLVGEQPGDQEDLAGHPFVGPAGQRRIHAKPNQIEIQACRPWLEAELTVLRPGVLVCLGATAAQALLGRTFRVTVHRGEWVPSPLAPHVLATVHPASILRAPDEGARAEAMEAFIRDLRPVARLLASGETRSGAPGS